jgi:YndJ-like protein
VNRVVLSPLGNAGIGAAIWLALFCWQWPSLWQPEWAVALLLLAALALVPLGLGVAHAASRGVLLLHLPAALLLSASFLLEQGWLAGVLSLPWLIVTGIIAWQALGRVRRRGLATLPDLCIDAGCIFLVVGGGWATLHRAGIRPLQFDDIIVLLTAIHFHYAGFVLPIVTGRAARRAGGKIANAASVGVIIGVPLTAAGITTTQLQWGSALECAAACLTAGAGVLTASLHARLALDPRRPAAVRALWTVAVACLFFSMVLAAIYGVRGFVDVTWLDIPWMRALHGTANALGFAVCGLGAWCLADRKSSCVPVHPHAATCLFLGGDTETAKMRGV